jgi:enoyl-[acyl-carrier protein] reductase I
MGIKNFSSIRDVYKERTPLRRNIELDDVADAATFLFSPASRGITGEILMVDAGFHVMGGA